MEDNFLITSVLSVTDYSDSYEKV